MKIVHNIIAYLALACGILALILIHTSSTTDNSQFQKDFQNLQRAVLVLDARQQATDKSAKEHETILEDLQIRFASTVDIFQTDFYTIHQEIDALNAKTKKSHVEKKSTKPKTVRKKKDGCR